MGKMRSFLGFITCLLMLITAGNVLAAGYSCPNYKKYTSCNSGYYISNCPTSSSSWTGQTISSSILTAGNSCTTCPANYTCSGGLTCPKANSVTCSAGYYLPANAFSCAECGGNEYWCPGGNFVPSSSAQGRNSVSAGHYSTGGTSTTRTGQSQCEAGHYCSAGVRHECSASLQYQDTAGATSCKNVSTGYYKSSNSSQTQCPVGYRDIAATSRNECIGSFSKSGSQKNGSIPTNCYSVISWNSCTPGTCTYKKKYNSGTIVSDCTPSDCTKTANTTTGKAGYYGYSNGSGQACSSCSSFNSSYPLSDDGATNSDYCYATKTKTGLQVNGSIPTNCHSVTSWNSCTPGTCTYKDYYAAPDTTCTPISCAKTANTTTGKAGYYGYSNGSGQACLSCSSFHSSYPLSDDGAKNSAYCYATKTKTGLQVNGSIPTNCHSVTSWNSCTPGTCTYKDYYAAPDTTCTPTNCTKTVAAVTANAGYYVNGITCLACSDLTENAFYPNSNNGNTGGPSACYTNGLIGQYVSHVRAPSASNCIAGSFKAYHTVHYGTTSSCSACTGATYSGAKAPACTSCPENYDANLDSNKTSINQCQIRVAEDFFIKFAGDTVATQCPVGYINEAELVNYNSTSECDPMEYTITLNKNGGTGTINGATGTTNATQICKHGEVCDLPAEGLTKENFTFTGWGTSASCTSGDTQMTFTGAKTIYACWSQNTTQCQTGKYYDGTSHVECPSGKYCPGTGYANEGQPGCASTCPAGYSGSDLGASKNTSCYKTCDSKNISGGTTSVVNSKVYYTGAAYPYCTYNVNCNEGYVAAGGGSISPTCNRCADGQYCPGGSSEEEPALCPVGSYCPAGIKTACPDSGTSALGAGTQSECYKTFDPYPEFQNGTASAKCFYNISGSDYTTCSIVNVSGCDAGYWYNGTTEFACNDVLNGYYSPEGSKTQTACPVAPDGSQVSSSENAASYTDCFIRCELEVANSSSVKPASDFVYGISADEYKACEFGVVCNTGYTVSDNNTSAPSCQANLYTITLNKNGGTGTISDSVDCVFDSQSCELPDTSSMVRPGYTVGTMWCSDASGSEPCYEGGTNISTNISANGTDMTLYAVWTPNVYKITLDDNGADSASAPSEIYLKYATNWFSDVNATQTINNLSVLPQKTGYEFGGYYSSMSGVIQIINSNGVLQKNASALQMTTAPATIYARWSAGFTTCQAGTYYTGNGTTCLTCPENSYCPGGEFVTDKGTPDGIIDCATLDKGDYKYSAQGASTAEQCYRYCETQDIINGTAIPIKDSEYYPNACQYRGESETGNPCEIKDGVCIETSCNSDYEMKNGICVPCDREFALSYKPDGNCRVASCVAGYHPKDKECVPDVQECFVPNATYAEQVWNYSTNSFGLCTVKECESGYHIASNACVYDIQPCDLEHGTGFKEWDYKNQRWGECIATSCDPGYTNDSSETNDRVNQCGECKNKYGRNGNIIVSSYIKGCEIATCMYQGELYTLENNECIQICPAEKYEDETGTMVWDENKKRCVRTCKEGYVLW